LFCTFCFGAMAKTVRGSLLLEGVGNGRWWRSVRWLVWMWRRVRAEVGASTAMDDDCWLMMMRALDSQSQLPRQTIKWLKYWINISCHTRSCCFISHQSYCSHLYPSFCYLSFLTSWSWDSFMTTITK
jgi:hypothetical protein